MNRLKEFRKAKNLTQKDLALIFKVTPDYISIIERNVQTPGFKLANKLADYFGVTVDELNFFETASNKVFEKTG